MLVKIEARILIFPGTDFHFRFYALQYGHQSVLIYYTAVYCR